MKLKVKKIFVRMSEEEMTEEIKHLNVKHITSDGESILSKRAVCKKAGISVTRFDKLVSDYPHLSNLRKRLQRLSSISLDPSDNL